MAIKFEKIQPGMKLYERRRERLGNTTLKTIRQWRVDVLSVDAEKRQALVSWNGNSPEIWGEPGLRKLHNWSMYDPDAAEIQRGMWDRVVKVVRKKKVKS